MEAIRASRTTFLGLFLVALATLSYEILLTRIFSVTMYYHFAFVAISVAMFGMYLEGLKDSTLVLDGGTLWKVKGPH